MTDDLDDIVAEASTFELKAEGEWFPATLMVVEKEEGQYGPQLKWIFICDEDAGQGNGKDGADRETWHFTAAKYTDSEKSGLRKFMKWLTGKTFDEGERIPIKAQVGERFDLMFEHVPTTEGKTREKVMRARPSKFDAPAETPKQSVPF